MAEIEPNVDAKINEYKALSKQKKLLDERLELLSKQIKASIGGGNTYTGSRYRAKVSLRKTAAKLDPDLLVDFLLSRGLTDCFKQVPDEDAIESAYLTGRISDDEMRSLLAERKIIEALNVEEIEGDEDISWDNEGVGG